MKRFLLWFLVVTLILAAVHVYKNRWAYGYSLRRSIPEEARLPRPVSVKRVLPCGGMGDVSVEFISEMILPETAAYNIADLVKRWETVWPEVENALRKELRDYEKEQYVKDLKPVLEVTVPQERWSADSKWDITLSFEPFLGIWSVRMSGVQKVEKCFVTF